MKELLEELRVGVEMVEVEKAVSGSEENGRAAGLVNGRAAGLVEVEAAVGLEVEVRAVVRKVVVV